MPVCISIGSGAFSRCAALKSINLPCCTTISSTAFITCTTLSYVNLSACQKINASTFSGCTSLETIILGNECSYIGSSAFYNCTSLMNLTLNYPNIVSLANTTAFTYTPMSASAYTGSFGSVYVPASLVDSYKTSKNWSTYSSRITSIPE